jgi:tetratricopeptide (TPR) repeat protein
VNTISHRPARIWPHLAGILLAALALRLALWAQPLHLPANDEIEYLRVAHDLLTGQGWSFYTEYRWLRSPLYPLWLAGSLWLAGGNVHLAALPNIILSVGIVGLVFALTRELAPRRAAAPALIAAGMAAVLFTAATFAGLYMSETLFAALFTGFLLTLVRWARTGARGVGAPALAGLLFGLACLTRSAPLTFAPVVMLWMAWVGAAPVDSGTGSVGRRVKQHLSACVPALVFAGVVALTIAPWTIRNCRAYSSCILIESGLAYNLWAFSEPRESLDEIHRVLEAIPNPVERAEYATERGLERLREDPAILLRKLPSNWIVTWTIEPIQDRFLLADYRADPPPIVFLGALIFDDLLYLVALCAAVPGLALMLSRRDRAAILCASWPVLFVAMALITHGETRYRHFFWMLILAYAAIGIHALHRAELRLPRPLLGAVVATLVVVLVPLFGWYPWGWAAEGAARSVQRQIGDLRMALGDLAGAEHSYLAALHADRTADGWIALGDAARQRGDPAAAEAAYRAARDAAPGYPAGSARLGDLLRTQGREEEAREAFVGRYVAEQAMADWAYRTLSPTPTTWIDVGSGLDFGYLSAVYPAELTQGTDVRWTSDNAELRLAMRAATTMLVTLRAAAPRPGVDPVPVEVCNAADCVDVVLDDQLRVVRLALPAAEGPITLRAQQFLSPDGRELGVLLDYAAVYALEPGGVISTSGERQGDK